MELNKLGKLGVAILEGFVGKHLGEGFIDELKSDFQTHDNLLRAMIETERIFRKTCEDKEFCKTIFDDLPITDLKPIQEAAQSFYSNPSDPILSETLKEIFIRDLKKFIPVDIEKHINSYISVLTQQLIVLDEKFSHKVNALANLATAEVVKESLKVMKDVAQDIHQISAADEQLLIKRFEKVTSQEQEIYFSEEIRTQLALVNKTIEILTKDQFQVINWLRDKKRVAISGCAGSGKTLVAAEKAIRLARAGLNVLILCHSPNLAVYLEKITANTGVRVFDFTSWIRFFSKQEIISPSNQWIHFEEPTEDELNIAFDSISNTSNKYDAILVDEGQDFRDTWWVIIEEALVNPIYGILYIFFDDNQALLPGRAKYPVEMAPFSLSKNCRNAGKVFNFIGYFHSQAPEETFFLSNTGKVDIYFFTGDDDRNEQLSEALSECLKIVSNKEIVVLTTEHVPVLQSTICDLEISVKQNWNWQQGVKNAFNNIAFRYKYHTQFKNISHEQLTTENAVHAQKTKVNNALKDLSQLSNEPMPTEEDITLVIRIAKTIADIVSHKPSSYQKHIETWRIYKSHKLELDLNIGSAAAKLDFFCNASWARTLPDIPKYKIISAEKAEEYPNSIPLYTVSSFKGLEAQAVILFIKGLQDQIMPTLIPDLYVGASRARFNLCIVANFDAAKYIPY